MLYFAYGSNCDPAVLARKEVGFVSRQPAALPGYRLLFNKLALRENLPPGIGYANINPDQAASVEGIVYEIVDGHWGRLDASERYPKHYTRIDVTVQTNKGELSCAAYQAQPDKIASGLRPPRDYLNHLLAAKDVLSEPYYAALEASQTFRDECACCRQSSEIVIVNENGRFHMLCLSCRDLRLIWGETHGRRLTVAETGAIMTRLVPAGPSFASAGELIAAAVAAKLIE